MPDIPQDMTRRTVTGMLWGAWGKGARAVLQIVTLAVLAHLVSPTDFGVVSASMLVISFATIFSQLGFGPALVQRPALESRHVEAAFTTSVLLGLALGATVWLAAPVIAGVLRMEQVTPVLRALAWVFPLQGFGAIAQALLRRQLRFRCLANIDVATYAAGYGVVGVSLALLGWGVWALVAAQIAQTLLETSVLLYFHPPRLRLLPEWLAFTELLGYGGWFTVALVASFVALQGDNLVVGRWLGAAALGLYDRAFQLMSAPAASFGMVLDNVLFPTLARVQSDPQRLALAYRRGVALIAIVMLPISAVCIVVAPELIRVVLGPRWTGAVAPFQILMGGMVFRSSYRMSDSLARATGAVGRRAWRTMAYAALVLGGAWVGQHWGLAGVATGAAIALVVNFFLMAQLSLRLVPLRWERFARAHAPAVAITAVVAPVAWLTATALRRLDVGPGLVMVVAAGSAAACLLALLRVAPTTFLGEDAIWMVDTLRRLLPERLRPILLLPHGPIGYGATRTGETHR